MKKRWIALIVLLAAGASLLRPGAFDLAATGNVLPQFDPQTVSERGAVTFAFGDWGGLSTDTLRRSATPWHLVNAALALDAAGGDAAAAGRVEMAEVYQRFGLLTPDSIANWPASLPQPQLTGPLGLVTGTAQGVWPPLSVDITNFACSACHASVVYGADGQPDTSRVWLGTPNGAINFTAYTDAIFEAVQTYGDDPALWDVVAAQTPDMGWRAKATLRFVVQPALVAEIAARDAAYGALLAFPPSLAGATNGFASLRHQLGLPTAEVGEAYTSIPDLGGRLWRRSLLGTGTYAVIGGDPNAKVEAADITDAHIDALGGIISFFIVPGMGLSQQQARATVPQGQTVAQWMADYTPQPFPGVVDAQMAGLGADIYAAECAACHGKYDTGMTPPQMVSFPNWQGDVGTDPLQASLVSDDMIAPVSAGPFADVFAVNLQPGYAAPPLAGLWSSGPYLHNASVPTLWHLMRPQMRPAQFAVGGHMIDFDRIGVALDPPGGYTPWSIPAVIDTTEPGRSNAGHEVGFDGLTEAEKDALLEFLKTL